MNKRNVKTEQEKIKLKTEINSARKNALSSMQFLVDIGVKRTRSNYEGTNKDLMKNKQEVIDYFLKEITAVVLLRHVCRGKARCSPLFKKQIFDEADKLMEELF